MDFIFFRRRNFSTVYMLYTFKFHKADRNLCHISYKYICMLDVQNDNENRQDNFIKKQIMRGGLFSYAIAKNIFTSSFIWHSFK